MSQISPKALNGRTILVTGAGDGLGRAAAKDFALNGAQVILLGKTVKNLESSYDDIEANGGCQPAIYPMDLSGATPEHYQELANIIQKEFGQLDGILHCAAQLGPRTSIAQYDETAWEKTVKVNVTAPFMLTKACLPLLQESDDASVVFVSSSVGRQGKAYWGAYAASKFALEGLMQTLSAELKNTSHIRVNSFNPGPLRTKMRAEAYPAENPETLSQPEFIASVLTQLMSSAGKGITGQALDAQGDNAWQAEIVEEG